MSRTSVFFIAALIGIVAWTVPQAAEQRPTWRQVLEPVTDIQGMQEQLLRSAFTAPEPGHRFVLLDVHVNPSAERLFVFSEDAKFVKELGGWQLATLHGEAIVYHQNQVHFSRAKTLEISVFDPASNVDRQIYPPAEVGDIRRAFIARVAAAYKAIGDEWFRTNNHPMDPEQFFSALKGDVTVDDSAGSMSFAVMFGGDEPLTFSETVQVTCAPLAPVAAITCRETIGK